MYCRSGSDKVVLRIVAAGEILMQTISCDDILKDAVLDDGSDAPAMFTYADM